jgi:hypothetical protein
MNLSNEQLQEKKAHLESELKKLQSDLVEILNQNDILTLENKTKDEIIISREKKLNEIKDKNTLDSEQLKTVWKLFLLAALISYFLSFIGADLYDRQIRSRDGYN